MVSGILSISRAPVESTIFRPALSTGTGGKGLTSDPVAMMIFFVSRLWLAPSFSVTPTALAPVIDPYYQKLEIIGCCQLVSNYIFV